MCSQIQRPEGEGVADPSVAEIRCCVGDQTPEVGNIADLRWVALSPGRAPKRSRVTVVVARCRRGMGIARERGVRTAGVVVVFFFIIILILFFLIPNFNL